MEKHITFGNIRDAGFTKAEVIELLNRVIPITQPTFDKRLKDQRWIHQHIEKLKSLGLWTN